MSLNKSSIDYLEHSEEILGRPGRSLNIVTGCEHHKSDICNVPCYARRMVERGRLKGNKAFPYGFEPTFHPERIRHYQNRDKVPMLIFLNTLGDVGGDWKWKSVTGATGIPKAVAKAMVRFAELNPEHIILLLTKNPAWYGLVEWPENVYPGFTATDNEEADKRYFEIKKHVDLTRVWCSLEPWYDTHAPRSSDEIGWLTLGGQTKPHRSISMLTMRWLYEIEETQPSCAPKIFVKKNSGWLGTLRQYPDEWKLN